MQSALKILFVDDHEGIRDGLGQMFTLKNDFLEFVYASNFSQAEEMLEQNTDIKVALVDINLDGENGLNLIPVLRKIVPSLKVIVYSMYSDAIHIEQALKSKIEGYVTKDSKLEELEKAIFAVADGNLYYNQRANQIMHLMLNKDNADQNDKDAHILSLVENYKMLSKKEQEVFKLLASGKTSKEIAEILGKAEKTIINQRSNIYGKLDLHDRLDVIEAAQALGVIA